MRKQQTIIKNKDASTTLNPEDLGERPTAIYRGMHSETRTDWTIQTSAHVSVVPAQRSPASAPEPRLERGNQMLAVVDIAGGEPKAFLQQLLGLWDGKGRDDLEKDSLQLLTVR